MKADDQETFLTQFNDSEEELDEQYGIYAGFIKSFLQAASYDQILNVEIGDDDEMWDDPPGFVLKGEISDASTDTHSIGSLRFGTIDGVPAVLEQNASPIIVWQKRK